MSAQGKNEATHAYATAYQHYARIGNRPWQAACLVGMAERATSSKRRALLARAEQLAQGSPAQLVRVYLAQAESGPDPIKP
ncbi:hypothetical protein ABTM35_19305, partial [Acinetobacter baumannii]